MYACFFPQTEPDRSFAVTDQIQRQNGEFRPRVQRNPVLYTKAHNCCSTFSSLALSLPLSLSHHSFVNVACTHALYIAVHARPMWEVCCCLLSHTVVRCFFIFINTSASQCRAARKGRELWCQRSVYRSLFNFSFYGGNTDASEVANLSLWNLLYAN